MSRTQSKKLLFGASLLFIAVMLSCLETTQGKRVGGFRPSKGGGSKSSGKKSGSGGKSRSSRVARGFSASNTISSSRTSSMYSYILISRHARQQHANRDSSTVGSGGRGDGEATWAAQAGFGETGMVFQGNLSLNGSLPHYMEVQMFPRRFGALGEELCTACVGGDNVKYESLSMMMLRAADWLRLHYRHYVTATILPQAAPLEIVLAAAKSNQEIGSVVSWGDSEVSRYLSILLTTTPEKLSSNSFTGLVEANEPSIVISAAGVPSFSSSLLAMCTAVAVATMAFLCQ